MTTLNAKANAAYHELIAEVERENPGDVWAGFEHERDAFETGFEAGHEAAQPSVAPRITDAAVEAALDVVMDDGHNGLDCRPGRNLELTVIAALEAAAKVEPQPVSDQCLRDALEKICDDYIAIDIELLRETLAAHPVEPAPPRPVVDREAVEEIIATKVMHYGSAGDVRMVDDSDLQSLTEGADAVLALINGTAK